MTATVRITICKPHDVVARLRVLSVSDGAVQSEQLFAAGCSEVMSEDVTLHAGVQIVVDEPMPAAAAEDPTSPPASPDPPAAAAGATTKRKRGSCWVSNSRSIANSALR